MNWKKWSCCLLTLGCLLVWGNMAVLWADEKEEVKKEEAKGSVLPPALQGFKFSSTIFTEWNAKSEYNGGPSTNSFKLNRAYLTLTKDFNSWLGMNVTTDLFTSVDPNDKNGLEVRMKFAYVNLNLFGTTTQLGMISTPSDPYDNAIWPYRVQGKNLLDDLGILSTTDIGVSNQGVFGGYMDEDYLKFAAKQFAGKWGGYYVGVYNGAGFDQTEANTDKVFSGLIYVRPAPMVPILKGLQIAYFGNYGKSNANFTAAGRTGDYPDWQVNVGQISLQHQLFAIMAQYYWGRGTKNSTEENNRSGYLVDGYLRIPSMEKLRVFGKYYYYDPNTDKANDGYTTYVAGLSYDVSKEFMPFVAYEHRSYESRQVSGKNDYDMFQIGFQLKF